MERVKRLVIGVGSEIVGRFLVVVEIDGLKRSDKSGEVANVSRW